MISIKSKKMEETKKQKINLIDESEPVEKLSKKQQKIALRAKQCEEAAEKNNMNMRGTGQRIGKEVDPDEIRIIDDASYGTQDFAVVSALSPVGAQRANAVYVKIRGCFKTRAEALAHCEKIMKVDPDFNTYIVKTGAWVHLPPTDNQLKNVEMEYMDKELSKIMKEHYKRDAESQTDIARRVAATERNTQELKKKNAKNALESKK